MIPIQEQLRITLFPVSLFRANCIMGNFLRRFYHMTEFGAKFSS